VAGKQKKKKCEASRREESKKINFFFFKKKNRLKEKENKIKCKLFILFWLFVSPLFWSLLVQLLTQTHLLAFLVLFNDLSSTFVVLFEDLSPFKAHNWPYFSPELAFISAHIWLSFKAHSWPHFQPFC
jgi:hypothetical protein